MDLWAQVCLLDRGARLGKTIGAYRDAYFKPGKRSGYVVYGGVLRDGADEAIYRHIGDICVSMTADDWPDATRTRDEPGRGGVAASRPAARMTDYCATQVRRKLTVTR